MRFREKLPTIVMTAVSAAILIFFASSDRATYAGPRQLDGCGWSEPTAAGPIWPRVSRPQPSWNPAFPPSPPNGRPVAIGCTKSSRTAFG